MTARTVIPAPTPLTWTVHSRDGITAVAWPINQRSPRPARTEGCRHRVKGPPGMNDSSETTRDPMTLHPGDVIVRHPDHPETGEWFIVGHPATDGTFVVIDYTMADGAEGRFRVPADQQVTVRVPLSHREAVITGLRELADFMEANPGLPDRQVTWILQYSVVGPLSHDGPAARAEIDRVADLLGVTAAEKYDGRWYEADRMFGALQYKAVHIRPDEDEETA